MTALGGVTRHRELQLLVLLVGLWQVSGLPPSSPEEGQVPVSEQKVLSLGLAYLLHGLEEISRRLEQQEALMEAQGNQSLGRQQKKNLNGGRVYRMVRKDLQILSAKKDKFLTEVQELQKLLSIQDQEQEVMEQQLTRVLQRLNSLAELAPDGQLDLSSMKVKIGKQVRRLTHLSFKVSSQQRVVDRNGLQIQHRQSKVQQVSN